mmetsp:Transcript_8985/g.9988  ORF Transcript_8985/g.9988 Transcript_8985/m.9988 type:complete len:119 (-) Transcript_8985:121-477(-)
MPTSPDSSGTGAQESASNGLWTPVKDMANRIATAPRSHEHFCEFCAKEMVDMWEYVDKHLDFADFPFSSAKVDCYLGVLTLTLAELFCAQSCGASLADVADASDFELKRLMWKKAGLC